MPAINFKAELFTIGKWTILLLPKAASEKLPSRGQTMVEGTINDVPIRLPLEPDGNWSHWCKLDETILKQAQAKSGDTVTFSLSPSKEWIEPSVPSDLQVALKAVPEIQALWHQITPMARWEWVRWIRSTNNKATRERRIDVTISKMKAGKRRPCCWNRNLSTEPDVSRNGVLLRPAAV